MSAMTSIHHHFNLREICKLDLSDEHLAKLDKPPPLKRPLPGELPRGEPHFLVIRTDMGDLKLFRVHGNGKLYVVTDTPQIAVALAEGRAKDLDANVVSFPGR